MCVWRRGYLQGVPIRRLSERQQLLRGLITHDGIVGPVPKMLASLLANMATIEHLFDKTQVGDTVLTKDDMRSLVEAATGTAPSRREVELLFDIFDSSRDELIHPHEARNALSGKHGD